MTYLYHVTRLDNLDSILKTGLLPSVGKRSVQLDEQPCIFLFPNKEYLEDALVNWLGDEFEEEEIELVILKINEKMANIQPSTVDWEVCSLERIQPNAIVEILDETMQLLDHNWNRRKNKDQGRNFGM